MKSDKKALDYIKNNKVFPLRNSIYTEVWLIEGATGLWDVRYDKQKSQYSCNCPNIRLEFECSHIKAVKLYKEKKNDTKNIL
jgi:hypothetical protein